MARFSTFGLWARILHGGLVKFGGQTRTTKEARGRRKSSKKDFASERSRKLAFRLPSEAKSYGQIKN